MAGDGDLVVREDLLGLLLNSDLGVVWDIRGTAGAGKSVLLRELERRAGGADVAVLVEMQDYFTPLERGDATAGGAGGLGGELRRFGRAVSTVMSGLLGRSVTAQSAVDGILNGIAQTARDIGPLGEAEARELAGELIERLREEVSRLIAARATAGSRRVYLLVDTFEAVLDHPLGGWLLRLLDGLDGAVVAVARRAGPQAPSLQQAGGLSDHGALEVLEIDGLTSEQVSDYLVRRLGAPGGEIAAAVHQLTGGHALAVALTADLASDMRRRAEPVTTDGLLAQLTGEPGQGHDDGPDTQLARLTSQFIQSVKEHDPEIAGALDYLWPLRRFDFPLLERLLPAAGGRRLAERLVSYAFVERRTPPGRPAERYYVVHDRVRDLGLLLLERASGEQGRIQALHRIAEEYYREHTDGFLAGYEGWFRYVDASWQVLIREWLYHVSQLDDSGQVNGRRGLAKLFFDAFWWQGYYVSFPFCEELLMDWTEMANSRQDGEDDAEWGEELRKLYARYPKGWRANATRDDWDAVRKHLEFFRDKPEIKDAGPDNRDMRHVHGQLKLFLGIAEWHVDPRSRKVEEYLQGSRELFILDEHSWDAAWVSFYQADAALWRGNLEDAIAAAERAWGELAEIGNDDFELAANLHRIHADAAWARGEHALALDLYARAALSAYKFQIAVGDPDIPPVVEYTQAFMTEMHERAAERLSTMHEAGEDQLVREACARIRQFFAPYWGAVGQPAPADPLGLLSEGRDGEVIGWLFPPPPEPADLHRPDTAYALTASEVLYDMEDELAEPPGTPLPPAAE